MYITNALAGQTLNLYVGGQGMGYKAAANPVSGGWGWANGGNGKFFGTSPSLAGGGASAIEVEVRNNYY